MSTDNLRFFFGAVLFLVGAPGAVASTEANLATNSLDSFEDAEAWNITVEKSVPITPIGCRPAFSPDFRDLAYLMPGGGDVRLAIRSVDEWGLKTEIKLPAETDLGGCVAYSPDGKKVVYGPVSLSGSSRRTGMLFVDLATSKLTPVDLKQDLPGATRGDRITWPNTTNLYLMGFWMGDSFRVNLDTLEVQRLPRELVDYGGKDQKISNHKNCLLDVSDYSFPGLRLPNLIVSSRRVPYTRVLFPDIAGYIEASGPNGWTIWTPDMRHILYEKWTFNDNVPPTLITLGLRATPMMEFEIKGLVETLSNSQRQQLKRSFTEGKRVWASVYDARVNPLTEKTVGPDEDKFRGQGFLTQIEPTIKFKVTFEFQSAMTSNIVSAFQVGDTWNWGSKVWGELARVGEGEKSDLSAGAEEYRNQHPKTKEPKVESGPLDPARKEIVELLEKAIDARGGRDVLERFRLRKTVTTTTGIMNGQSFTMQITQYVQLPDKLRVDQEASIGGRSPSRETFYILGDASLTVTKPTSGFIPKKMTSEGEARLRQALYLLECESLAPLLDSQYQLEKVLIHPAQQEHAIAIRVRKRGKPDVMLFFDDDTALLIGTDCSAPAKNGGAVETHTHYSGFRNFSGLVFPTTVKYSEGSDIESTSKNESVMHLDSFPEPASTTR